MLPVFPALSTRTGRIAWYKQPGLVSTHAHVSHTRHLCKRRLGIDDLRIVPHRNTENFSAPSGEVVDHRPDIVGRNHYLNHHYRLQKNRSRFRTCLFKGHGRRNFKPHLRGVIGPEDGAFNYRPDACQADIPKGRRRSMLPGPPAQWPRKKEKGMRVILDPFSKHIPCGWLERLDAQPDLRIMTPTADELRNSKSSVAPVETDSR